MSDTRSYSHRQSVVPAAKVVAPSGPSVEVLRSVLEDEIDNIQSASLVLVHGPAGFGKTTIMLQLQNLLQSEGAETAWLTLDPADNDISRFISCIAAATHAWKDMESAHISSVALIESLAKRNTPFALFLDDFEAVPAATVTALVRSILDVLPKTGKLIIGTRVMHDIGVARLRARGRLFEIDSSVLRFNIDETNEYFALRKQLGLTPELVYQLHQKTEGWIAALWLASLAMERKSVSTNFIENFSAGDKALGDFLAEDVLAHQAPNVTRFLLRTSILRYLEPDLCHALVPDSKPLEVLGRLVSENIFISSLPSDYNAYRYHSLFLSFLRRRLALELPNEVRQLHLVAAKWYESKGRYPSAIDHAIKSESWEYAVSMLLAKAHHFLEEGRMRLLTRWFEVIPEGVLGEHSLLQAIRVWSLLFTAGPTAAYEAFMRFGYDKRSDSSALAHANAQIPLLLAMADKYGEALQVGSINLCSLPTSSRFADNVLRNAMANVLTVMGDNSEAQKLIDSARGSDGKSIFFRMYAESQEGMINFMAGRLQQATACFESAVLATKASSTDLTGGNAWAGILYACALYEAHDFDMAERLVDVYLPMACDAGLPDHMYMGHIIKARISFSRGDVSSAFCALTDLEYLGHHRGLQRVVSSAKLERSRLLLLQGDAQGAKEELTRAGSYERSGSQDLRLLANETSYAELSNIRWDIHFGDSFSALAKLNREISEAVSQHRYLRIIKLQIVKCIALQRSGDASSALKLLADTLKSACSEGFVQLFIEEGVQALRLIQRYKLLLDEMVGGSRDSKLVAYLGALLTAFGDCHLSSETVVFNDVLLEPLTRKELHVIQLTADGCSNAELSRQLKLSDSTVRTHLRNINSKLNCHSRSEAVATARRLSLIT